MTHRVHTILSILADDHAPAALRPSILLAIDWPTVAEEAPATGDDATAATLAALRIRGAITSDHQALAPCAARLATVAASLTTTGDKAHALHAAALWGAAAALVGLPSTAPPVEWAELIAGIVGLTGACALPSHTGVMLDAVKRWHHVAHSDEMGRVRDERDTARRERDAARKTVDALANAQHNTQCELANVRSLLDKSKNGHDKVIADIHALRDILKVPAGGNIVDHASAFAERHMRRVDEATAEAHRVNEDNSRLRAQVDRMIAAMREDAPPAKARPQPGDVVPWAEVEDGSLYFDRAEGLASPFLARQNGREGWLDDEDDRDVHKAADGRFGQAGFGAREAAAPVAILVARNLGTDPEAWCKAMREWVANPATKHAPGRRSCPHRQDGDASACDHCCMFG